MTSRSITYPLKNSIEKDEILTSNSTYNSTSIGIKKYFNTLKEYHSIQYLKGLKTTLEGILIVVRHNIDGNQQ
jgi:hypothetical protein